LQEPEPSSPKIAATATVTATPFVVDAASVTGRPARDGALIERTALGAHTDSPWLEQSVLELEADGACARATGTREEVLFVLSGHGTLRADGLDHDLEPATGAYLPPGLEYELSAPRDEDLLIVSVRVPDPVGEPRDGVVLRRLADLEAGEATAERWFRIVSDPDTGLRSATQFVGYIPPGRANDHFHTYDEVIYVLGGTGAFHAGGQSWALGPGSCVALPSRTVHCLENTGPDVLRVLGVFRPAGSPAAAYYPDGTPASYSNEQSLHEEEVQA
jgi:mannose-6-phosphate isomerase-like protein (cupin superfamily)